jgi:BlaI family transcriptional regulator, penicillinase repressor
MQMVTLKPTESELEVLQILWNKGQATVREVHDNIAEKKDVGYTTTLKIMQIMHQKELVKRDVTAKTHIYIPNISKTSTQQQMVDKMVNTLFNGNAAALVMNALGSTTPSQDDIEAIENYLKQFKS